MLHWVANFNTMTYPDDWPQRTHIWWMNWEDKTRTTRKLGLAKQYLNYARRAHPSVRYALVSRSDDVWNDIESGWGFRNEKGQ